MYWYSLDDITYTLVILVHFGENNKYKYYIKKHINMRKNMNLLRNKGLQVNY